MPRASPKAALFFTATAALALLSSALIGTTPPLPLLPLPSSSQLEFQSRGLSIFFHFGINTFTNVERGTGLENPSSFDPSGLNTTQWMQAAKAAGAKLVILTAKHHDGFCLWPSAYTKHSVASSPWKGGKGDVVGEFVRAAREEGLEVGLYLSPWDMHESCYGDTLEYNEFYLAQLRELLTVYGSISEVWLDGAKGPNAPDMNYKFKCWFDTIHQLQPNANIFSDAGPDVRWVGNEAGEADSTCWSMVNKSSIVIGNSEAGYLESGDMNGMDWVPPECDISIRPGWFWHSNETAKSLNQLLEIYYKSSGRNCLLLLNVPPNSTGLIEDEDFRVLKQFRAALDSIFSVNLAANASVTASSSRSDVLFEPGEILNDKMKTYWAPKAGEYSGWLELDLGKSVTFNVVEIQEAVSMGQRVMEYHFEAWSGDGWSWLSNGTTVGYRKLDRFNTTQSQVVRLVIESARADPLIAHFGLYLDNYTISSTPVLSMSTAAAQESDVQSLFEIV